ncbi:hypothetical protein ACNKHO_20635 [Shigella flexneri]
MNGLPAAAAGVYCAVLGDGEIYLFAIFPWRTMMQLEVILPLMAYIFPRIGLSIYAMRKRWTGTFMEQVLPSGEPLEWAASCWP